MKPSIPIVILLILFCGDLLGQGQEAASYQIARERSLWHDNIDKAQLKLQLEFDRLRIDTSTKLQALDAITRQVNEIQMGIETDSTLNSNDKGRYLRTLEYMLRGYGDKVNKRDFGPTMGPALVKAFEKGIDLNRKKESIKPLVDEVDYGIGKILVDCFEFYFADNPGMAGSKVTLLRKYINLHPDQALPVLRDNPNVYFADSLISVVAQRDTRRLYDYAAARNKLGDRIRNHPDTFVNMVARMANSKSGQLYFPFLDNLLKGRITLAEIDSVKEDDFKYFRLMVKTRIDYAARLLPPLRDTAHEMKALTAMMASKAKQYFVREINALHDVSDSRVRFKRLEGLTPQELYYISVLSEDELYTSSYVSGVYPRIFERMANPRGDSLLMSVHGDFFRKFIKMAAGYNTLNNFLGTMGKENAATLMQSFVIGLEKPKPGDELEDAVDVADSYSSIMDKDKEMAGFVLNQVRWSYEKNVRENNKRGIVIYNLLKILFQSADTTTKTDLSAQLGIPSIYDQDYKGLVDDSGRVVQQVFFYGDEDKDGQLSFINFMNMFRGRAEWRINEKNPEWVTITSTKGKPVWIFANRPLLGDDDPDDKAQNKLIAYLEERNLKPSVVIHRGHSYHLASTLKKLAPTAKIVVLGSCGGYNNLNEVLTICKDAHIISSKQVGTKVVNEPILQAINNNLVAGRNIDWISMWRDLTGKFRNDAAAKEKFDDYIPPYKNLGAIFIKAYRKAMGEE
ncbi:hypothetical protein [Pseudobacter ginsenosidimutans]|uniref:Uncharacterized protein n=1 Tax=Pseudobacter ginsenosidimutans TaxID=661488 RepID=A0A4Q7MW11_9BACT|nr:hypothetical protein [Pseudobacter ginsenosidimutans]QEC41933.1 hypothetical protein FSB84_09630 [Pseudobacter ginsenosidimutans]RZS71240.1 hypothetical protein EV199_3142 [Pseudobacter ginsenosidimutans]